MSLVTYSQNVVDKKDTIEKNSISMNEIKLTSYIGYGSFIHRK